MFYKSIKCEFTRFALAKQAKCRFIIQETIYAATSLLVGIGP